ncbi:M20/M25/M40 family metallo-hydrolase [Paeniglutamicibacter kerguelensis]|nr:M20/M25/M40 family metallo-hydrolase [Paeniglutamicibacter kerguelensis]
MDSKLRENKLQALEANKEALMQRVEEQAGEYLSWLIEFASIPSISATGEGVRECAEHLASRIASIGLKPELLETGAHPIVWAAAGESERKLLVYGHYDVVPPGDDAQWKFPPFEPTVFEGSLWGRGVGDSKGQMIAHLCALAAWIDVFGELPPFQINFMFDGEDEIGCGDTSDYIRANVDRFRADFLYTSDASTLGVWDPALFLGIRGALYVELNAKGADNEWHSGSYGSILPNPVTQMAQAIATLVDKDGRVAIDGFFDGMEPITTELRDLAAKLPAGFLPPAETFGVREFERDAPIDSMFFEPRMCVCGIEGGYTGQGLKMAVPTSATAKIDFALLKGQRPSHVATLLRAHLDAHGFEDIEITVLSDAPPSGVTGDHPLVSTAVAALESVWGRPPVVIPSIGGGGVFATFVDAVGLDCLLVPYAQPDMQEHSAQEHLSLEWFTNGIKTSAEVFRRLAIAALERFEAGSAHAC